MDHATWIVVLSWFGLVSGAAAALAIAIDIGSGRRQTMKIMEVTWPVTALYMGPFGWWAYESLGRAPLRSAAQGRVPAHNHAHEHGSEGPRKPRWQSVFVSVTHCGGGCTLGDIFSDSLIYLSGVTLAGSALATSYVLDFTAAYMLGVIFQYLPIRAMGEHSRWRALVKAVKADTLSLIAFEVGLFGWMALVQLVLFPGGLQANDPVFWFMMQIGMVIGFATAYPANWWLVHAGIKHAM